METNVVKGKWKERPSLGGMLLSPSVQFSKLKVTQKVWSAFFLVVFFQAIVKGISSYAAQNTAEMIEIQKQLGDVQESMGLMIGRAMGTSFFGALIGTLLVAMIYKVFLMFFGNDTSYKMVLAIIVYASIVLIIGDLFNAIVTLMFGGNITGYTNLAPLFQQGTLLHGMASAFEVFYLWYLGLIWMGLRTVAGLSKVKSSIPVVVIFLIQAAFITFGTMMVSKFM
ncbi:Yip1 family protein [Bacillus sp. FSL R12-0069]|uniref:Yip1 family protein n=1 Tax=Bacillus sp. FSL R12-0069 TaxID=2975342 RepID=UPI0030F9494D